MKPSRPKKVITISETSHADGWSGFFLRNLNTISTVVLLILAAVMFARWRLNVKENARIQLGSDLTSAQGQVSKLRGGFANVQSPADRLKEIQQTQSQASAALSSIVNNTDADERTRAEAFALRGDMYWYLANLPPMPGSDSEPSLRLSESTDTLLNKASDSYQQILRDPAFANQHEQINIAHLGLSAIAENRGDWAAAQKELETVRDDPNAVKVLADAAKVQLEVLDKLKQPLYVVPPSGVAASQPAFGPFITPGAATKPTTSPDDALSSILQKLSTTTQPATRPAGH